MSTTTPIKLLLTGLIPSSEDVPQYFRDLYGSAAEIEAKIQADKANIEAAGYDVTMKYFDDADPETGLEWLEQQLRTKKVSFPFIFQFCFFRSRVYSQSRWAKIEAEL